MKAFAWLCLVALVGSYLCVPIADPDLWWHITVGRWIIAHQEVPVVDHWNLFGVGQPWRAYSWSNEVVYAWVEQLWGEKGLAIARLCLALLFVGAMQYILGCLAGSYCIGALLGVFTSVACMGHFSLRPQTVTWTLFACVLLVADRVCKAGVARATAVAAAVIGCVWANTHLSAILGVFGLALWSLNGSAVGSSLRRTLVLVGCFIIGSLISPYMGGEWLTLFEKSSHAFRFNSIDEFRPAHIRQYSSGFVVIQIALLLTLCFSSNRVPSFNRIVLAVSMLLLGLAVVKFLPFAIIALSALVAVWWRDNAGSQENVHSSNKLVAGLAMLERFISSRQSATLGALGFFFACIAWVSIVQSLRQPVDYSGIPKSSVDFIEAKSLEHPVVNEFGDGGYLMYRFSSPQGEPQHLVALDGRTNINPPKIWKGYEAALRGGEEWDSYIRAVNSKTIVWRQDAALASILLVSPEWCRVFRSSVSLKGHAVFISRDQFNRRRDELQSDDCS